MSLLIYVLLMVGMLVVAWYVCDGEAIRKQPSSMVQIINEKKR
ncbi:MAG: hypothetical protein ACFFCS_10910 [Candidatus Hodarchaeota archaeon]